MCARATQSESPADLLTLSPLPPPSLDLVRRCQTAHINSVTVRRNSFLFGIERSSRVRCR